MSDEGSLPAAKRRWAMLCILAAVGLNSLDSAIANIALPTITRTLATTDAAAVWIVNGFQLAVTICLLPGAVLGETRGLRRVYAAGMTLFTLASLGCALSPTLPWLVFARLMQGVGGAGMSVTAVALVRTIYPRAIVSSGYALIALTVATAAALGPTVAALILAVASWPWLFLVNVPFGVVAVALAFVVMLADRRVPRQFDWLGTVLNALAFGAIVVGIHELGEGGRGVALSVILLGVICFGLLVYQQSHRTKPLLPLDLLRMPVFLLAVATSICAYTAQVLAYVSVPFLFETVLHLSPVETGLLVTPWPLLVAIAAPIAGKLTRIYPVSTISSIGMVVLGAGLLSMALLPADPAYWNIVWRLGVCGIGFGLFQTPNNTAMMTTGPMERSGAASGMNAVARFMGMSLGSAVTALIFGLGGLDATRSCLEAAAVFSVIGAAASAARRFGGAK